MSNELLDEVIDEILNPPEEDRCSTPPLAPVPKKLQEEQLKLAQEVTLTIIRDCPSYMADYLVSAFSVARESLRR